MLAVGIDDYDPSCGFPALTTRRNDALGFADCFRDIPQLGADPGAIITLASRGPVAPSRGELVKALRELARTAAADDRLIFYFSGYGHRLAGDPEAYLVPQDVYADDDPTCLLALSMITDILGGSPAAQRLVILDVSLRSSDRAAFDARLRDAAGVTLLATSAGRRAARSENPQHSPFTALLLPALRGQIAGALVERRLTLASACDYLSAQRPIVNAPGDATVLADFSGPLLGPDVLESGGALFDGFELTSASRPISIKEILPDLARTNYSQSYLERRANEELGARLAEEFGRAASRLRGRFKWASSAVHVDDRCVTFPDGRLEVRYDATEKLRGVRVATLSLQPAWLEAPGAVADLLDCLELAPRRVTFSLRSRLALRGCVPKLEAGGWRIDSELSHQIAASKGDCSIVLEDGALTLVDLPLRALFAATPDEDAMRTASAALALLGGP